MQNIRYPAINYYLYFIAFRCITSSCPFANPSTLLRSLQYLDRPIYERRGNYFICAFSERENF